MQRDGTQFAWERANGDAGEFGWSGEVSGYAELESPFDEAEEMELAAQLLEIQDEAELNQFIGDLFKKVRRVVGRMAKSQIGGMLKNVAKTALPFVGGALGSFMPIPGVGTAVGTALGSAVSTALEAEMEGIEPEDQEFELARRFVRLAGTAARQVAQTPPTVDPQKAAQAAVMAAARQLLGQPAGELDEAVFSSAGSNRPRSSGRWLRRGNTITLVGM